MSAEEDRLVPELASTLAMRLEAGAADAELEDLALVTALYRPLSDSARSDRLSGLPLGGHRDAAASLIERTIAEPRQQLALSNAIPVFGSSTTLCRRRSAPLRAEPDATVAAAASRRAVDCHAITVVQRTGHHLRERWNGSSPGAERASTRSVWPSQIRDQCARDRPEPRVAGLCPHMAARHGA